MPPASPWFHRLYLRALTLLFPCCLGLVRQAPGQHPVQGALADSALAASRAGQWAQAARHWSDVVRMNPVNPGYWTHLALARGRTGDHRGALAALQEELALGSRARGDVFFDMARAHGHLENRVETLAWLERSYEAGMRHYGTARRDTAFAVIRADPAYRALVGLIDRDTLSRDDGWRYDIAFLYRALRRIHIDLFREHPRSDFELAVEALQRQVPALNDDAILVRLMALTRMAGDAHTNILPEYVFRRTRVGVPVTFYDFVEGIHVSTAAPGHQDLLGAEVVRVGGRDVGAVLDSVGRIVSRDNPQWLREWGPHLLAFPQILHGLGLIPRRDTLPFEVRLRNGTLASRALALESGPVTEAWGSVWRPTGLELPLYLRHPDQTAWMEPVAELGAVYVKLDRVRDAPDESLAAFASRVVRTMDAAGARRLILDLRDNGGGNLTLTRPLLHALLRRPDLQTRGNFYVIIGRRTFSAAQITAARLDLHFEPIFVGEPTGSRPNFVGETVYITLPYSGLEPSISNLAWQGTLADDTRLWIGPDLHAPPSLASVRRAEDPAMAAIAEDIQRRAQPGTRGR